MITKNTNYESTIEDLTKDGAGVCKIDGFTMFVENTLPGDRVEIRAVKLNKNYGFGKVVRVISPSPDRVSVGCLSSDKCGGCSLQFYDYAAQLSFKKNLVENALKRIGGFTDEISVNDVIGMETPLNYRNKAQFPIGYINGEPTVGFYSRRSHNLIEICDCRVLHPVNKEIIRIVNSFLRRNNISAYDEATNKGLARHLMTRVGFSTGEIMVCLVINGKSLPKSNELVNELSKISGMASVCLNINTKKTNVVLGGKTTVLYGKDHITDCIGDLKFNISPLSFFQVNSVQAKVLYEKALEFAALEPNSVIIDAYCGIGTISLLFAREEQRKVIGIEFNPQAIKDAEANAKLNKIDNTEFLTGLSEEVLPELLAEISPDAVILDPPRKGCDAALIDALLVSAPPKIVYVSCDAATLARDLRVLGGKYDVARVQPVDMFPFTNHVETVVLLSKLKSTESIEVRIDLDEMDLTQAERKATYDEIKSYVLDKYGFKVSQLYIAQVKRKHGIIERENYNTGEGKTKVPQVPEDKEKAIEDALRHFQMI